MRSGCADSLNRPSEKKTEDGDVTEWRANLDIPFVYHQVPVDAYFPVHRTRSMV